MTKAAKVFFCIALLGLIGRVATLVVAQTKLSRAELTQRIRPYDKDTEALTGEPGDALGPSEKLIIDDPKAILPLKGKEGQRLVNEEYLTKNGIYPLQAKTVEYVSGLVGYGFLGVFLVGLVGGIFLRSRTLKSQSR